MHQIKNGYRPVLFPSPNQQYSNNKKYSKHRPTQKINEWPRYVGKSIFLTACISGAPAEVTLLESNNDLWYKKMRVQWWHATLHA